MSEYMYRFRNIDKLLGEKQELKNQTIFFASPDKLNDPMEGFRDVFWSGDEVAWKNLFKHYLMCLENVCAQYLIGGEDYLIEEQNIPVFKNEDQYPTEKYSGIFKDICNIFFNDSKVTDLIQIIYKRKSPIRRDELYFYLKAIHFNAVRAIFHVYSNNNLAEKNLSDVISQALQTGEFKPSDISAINNEDLDDENKLKLIETIFSVGANIDRQMELIQFYNSDEYMLNKNKTLVLVEFPEKYIDQINSLMYPNWYTACFMSNCTNSSVWGHYGDNHKGVCLKFKTRENSGWKTLKLNGITGVGGSKNKMNYIYGDIDHSFHKVRYKTFFPEVDFFRSLGSLPISTLNKFWYFDENGNRSICAEDMYENEEMWRSRYWDKFYEGVSNKLKDWEYENEYRLVIAAMAIDHSKPENRALKYRFEDLEGIIFGINTSKEHKIEISKIIEDKCHKENRYDIKFYQAGYSKHKGEIEAHELSLLNFKKQ